MSLSFVTKAIQTTAADGTFEETAVENAEDRTAGSRRNNEHAIGLFDQLRQNQDEAEAARLEFQRSIMRGTLALDEDDVAHLQQLQQLKEVEHMTQLQQTESQLASFRAAQAERLERAAEMAESSAHSAFDAPVLDDATTKPIFAPAISIRKRKRKEQEPTMTRHDDDNIDPKSDIPRPDGKVAPIKGASDSGVDVSAECSHIPSNVISSLLSGYSSDESS